MIHPAFKRSALTFNGSPHGIAGVVRATISGGLTYRDDSGVEQCAWVGGYHGPNGASDWATRWQEILPENLDAFAESITDPIFVLNVEHYAASRLGKLIDILERIRAVRPDLAIGVWSLVPRSEFWTVYNYAAFLDFKAGHPSNAQPASWWNHPNIGPAYVAAFARWQADNELVARKLVPHVDFLCPSVYPVIDPAGGLEWTAEREPDLMIAECRRLAPELPVLACYYPFVSRLKRPASATLTRSILRACRAVDGVIHWGDANTPAALIQESIDTQTYLTADRLEI